MGSPERAFRDVRPTGAAPPSLSSTSPPDEVEIKS
jgi:hypothetical protein